MKTANVCLGILGLVALTVIIFNMKKTKSDNLSDSDIEALANKMWASQPPSSNPEDHDLSKATDKYKARIRSLKLTPIEVKGLMNTLDSPKGHWTIGQKKSIDNLFKK